MSRLFSHIRYLRSLSIGLLIVMFAVLTVSPLPAKASNPTITVHTYASPGEGSVNTHWIETDEGIIVIDGQRELSQAEKVLAQIKETGKPIIGIFLTHAHPDHIGGIGVFAKSTPEAPIYGSQATRDEIGNDPKGYIALSQKVLGNDYPEKVTVPNHLVKNGDAIKLDGVEIDVKELGPNEATSITLLHIPQSQILFSGDLINNGMTPFLLESHTSKWVEQLKELSAMFPDVETIYPGHGQPGSKDLLINNQLEYLERVRALVANHFFQDGHFFSDEEAKLVEYIKAQYPEYKPVAEIPGLIKLNLDAVASELAN